jgi:hypothetical protein
MEAAMTPQFGSKQGVQRGFKIRALIFPIGPEFK